MKRDGKELANKYKACKKKLQEVEEKMETQQKLIDDIGKRNMKLIQDQFDNKQSIYQRAGASSGSIAYNPN